MKIKREETGESFASSTISESLELAPAEAPTECLSKNSALSARGTKKEASAVEGRGCKIFQDPKYGSRIFLLLGRLLYRCQFAVRAVCWIVKIIQLGVWRQRQIS